MDVESNVLFDVARREVLLSLRDDSQGLFSPPKFVFLSVQTDVLVFGGFGVGGGKFGEEVIFEPFAVDGDVALVGDFEVAVCDSFGHLGFLDVGVGGGDDIHE